MLLQICIFKSQKAYEPLVRFLEESFVTVPLTSAIKDYGRIRALLESQGIRLEGMDLFIAATAIANDYTLVSHNIRHFSRIPGLKLEDWGKE